MKQYFYHKVPEKMIGNTLFPLNSLPKVDMATYESARVKYTSTNRENLFDFYNPVQDCLWNDVIFMIAVQPQEIFYAANNAGIKINWSHDYYKIDMDTLDLSLLGVYQARLDWHQNSFSPFNKTLFDSYSTLPSDVYAHFKKVKETPVEKRFYYPLAYVPHILYKGPIDITNVEIISI